MKSILIIFIIINKDLRFEMSYSQFCAYFHITKYGCDYVAD